MNIEENKKKFEDYVATVKREGINDLMNYLQKTDFFVAPASTRFHNSVPGGLCDHSLGVLDCLCKKKTSPYWAEVLAEIPDESFIISALFHDMCKANFYVATTKNQKTYDPEKVASAEPWQVKHDSRGRFVWETIDAYSVDDQEPLGHGSKSVIMLQRFIKLTDVEIYAINYHMGFSLPDTEYSALSSAMQKHPFCLALIEADLESTLMEDRRNMITK